MENMNSFEDEWQVGHNHLEKKIIMTIHSKKMEYLKVWLVFLFLIQVTRLFGEVIVKDEYNWKDLIIIGLSSIIGLCLAVSTFYKY
mmetsp:Transcript_42654/g.65429  ORF Transcript_42654/g.65429 Transcript_42654/m.65429 type:complete len:86 (-) Transcript_42654:73-330(-)